MQIAYQVVLKVMCKGKNPALLMEMLWEEGAEQLSQLIYLVFSSRSLCDSFWVGGSSVWKIASYAQLCFLH